MILAGVIISLGGINHRIEGLASFWQTTSEFDLTLVQFSCIIMLHVKGGN
jgi:hypothetical protein